MVWVSALAAAWVSEWEPVWEWVSVGEWVSELGAALGCVWV